MKIYLRTAHDFCESYELKSCSVWDYLWYGYKIQVKMWLTRLHKIFENFINKKYFEKLKTTTNGFITLSGQRYF